MSRTRITFFVVLALFLLLIAVALTIELASSRLLQQMFIAATVFGAGVVLLDFLGILGGHHGDAGDDLAGDAGHADAAAHDGGDHAGGEDGGAGHDGQAHPAAQPSASPVAAAPILSALTYLRLFVYFCLGFGPAGWVVLATGRSPLASLGIAAAFGAGSLFLALAFFRFQRSDTDSRLRPTELVGREATVIVALDDRTMGKVRVTAGLNVADLYALAADAGRTFEKGAPVRIADVTDECVYVR